MIVIETGVVIVIVTVIAIGQVIVVYQVRVQK